MGNPAPRLSAVSSWWAFVLEAMHTAGSPGRRPMVWTGESVPVTSRTVSRTSRLVWPAPLRRTVGSNGWRVLATSPRLASHRMNVVGRNILRQSSSRRIYLLGIRPLVCLPRESTSRWTACWRRQFDCPAIGFITHAGTEEFRRERRPSGELADVCGCCLLPNRRACCLPPRCPDPRSPGAPTFIAFDLRFRRRRREHGAADSRAVTRDRVHQLRRRASTTHTLFDAFNPSLSPTPTVRHRRPTCAREIS